MRTWSTLVSGFDLLASSPAVTALADRVAAGGARVVAPGEPEPADVLLVDRFER